MVNFGGILVQDLKSLKQQLLDINISMVSEITADNRSQSGVDYFKNTIIIQSLEELINLHPNNGVKELETKGIQING